MDTNNEVLSKIDKDENDMKLQETAFDVNLSSNADIEVKNNLSIVENAQESRDGGKNDVKERKNRSIRLRFKFKLYQFICLMLFK